MEPTPLGGHMASQQQQQQRQEREQAQLQEQQKQDTAEQQAKKPQPRSLPPPPIEAMMLCSSVPSSTCRSGVGGSNHSDSRSNSRNNKSPSPIATAAFSLVSSARSARPSTTAEQGILSAGEGVDVDIVFATSTVSSMQRHRKKDRVERAPPTIQKYLQFTAGASGGASNPALVPASENLYQPCGGVNFLSTNASGGGDGNGDRSVCSLKAALTPSAETVAATGCCRKDDLFQATAGRRFATGSGGCYPEDNPDSIEVYREASQHGHTLPGLRLDINQRSGAGVPCHQYRDKWCELDNAHFAGEEVHRGGSTLRHHHHHHLHGDTLTPPQTGRCASDTAGHIFTEAQQQQQLLHHSSVPGGNAEYSYAYCEPILLQRPVPDGPDGADGRPLPSSTGSSSYCMPMYMGAANQRDQHHVPALPLPLVQQKSIRSFPGANPRTPYAKYSVGSRGSAKTTLHHHHHHHHHNYTLPTSGSSSSGSTKSMALPAAAQTAATTTTTGSLRALFTNIFRKSASSSPSPSAAVVAAVNAPPPSASLFLDGVGDTTLHRSSGLLLVSAHGAERHSFTTCYGTKENIYEDIGSQSGLVGSALGSTGANQPPPTPTTSPGTVTTPSLPPPPLPNPTLDSSAGSPTAPAGGTASVFSLAAEWQRVQLQHERTIGELNLSVERLIMPSYDDEHCQERPEHPHSEVVSLEDGGCSFTRPCNPIAATHLGSSKRLCFAPASTSSPPAAGALVVVERHSPTISYGKSYGDVDSGISSSSTSGTSYSSSILYRSITNYHQQQQQDGGAHAALIGGQLQQSHQTPPAMQLQHHPPHRKVTLFGLRTPAAGATFSSGRVGSCRGIMRDHHGMPGPSNTPSTGTDSPGMHCSSNVIVTNAPDPPPPPDAATLHSSAHTLASCCFFAERPFLGTGTTQWRPSPDVGTEVTGLANPVDRFRSERSSSGGGNFWNRFRKLHGKLISGGGPGKLSGGPQQENAGAGGRPDLEDFAPAGPLWPMHQYYHQYHSRPPQHLPLQQQHRQPGLPSFDPPHPSRSEQPMEPVAVDRQCPTAILPHQLALQHRDRDHLYPFPAVATPPPVMLPAESTVACNTPPEPDEADSEKQTPQQEPSPRRSPSPSSSASSSTASSAASTGSSSGSSPPPSSPSSAGSSSSSSAAKLSGGNHHHP